MTDTQPLHESEYAHLVRLIESISSDLGSIKKEQERLEARQDVIDKILIRGNGVPSLQETVRTLERSLTDFINDTRLERTKREENEKEERRKRDEERTRWRWAIIPIALSAFIAFAYQFFVFWVKIAPVIESINIP
jgi:hypothetical protein